MASTPHGASAHKWSPSGHSVIKRAGRATHRQLPLCRNHARPNGAALSAFLETSGLAEMVATRRTRLLAPMRRLFSSSSPAHGRHTLPILRLPTTLFPHQCFSLSLEPPEHERRYNVLTPQQLQEAWKHGGRLAALAWGSSIGVELQLLDDTEARAAAPLPTPPGVAHAVGGRRLRLFELLDERSDSGSRIGVVAPLDDDGGTSAAEAAPLRAEADAARSLLHTAATPIELSPCTLDEELLLSVCDPRCHPLWRSQVAPPDDEAELSLWLAARLSLTTALRSHLLGCTDPLKRMRDCVDAMSLLADPRQLQPTYAKFQVVWDTAESGGCELAPPVATIDWAKNAHK